MNQEALTEALRGVQSGVWRDDGELVAAPTCADVSAAQSMANGSRDVAEDPVDDDPPATAAEAVRRLADRGCRYEAALLAIDGDDVELLRAGLILTCEAPLMDCSGSSTGRR